MENVVWGLVPAQRTRKQEKFNGPVVTMSAIDKPGAGRKFSFNKAAQELLGIVGEDRVSFGFIPAEKSFGIFVRKVTDDSGFLLTKTCTFSDKKTYEFIAKRLDLNTEVETNFDVAMVAGQNYAQLTLKTSDNVAIPAEIASIDTEADNDVEDIAEHIDTDPISEVEESLETVQDDEESTEEDVW
jgi:hypothetical protein